MKLGLEGKRVLVLGASQGLGNAIAIALLEEGAVIYAAARSIGKLNDWKSKLKSADAERVHTLRLDLADLLSVDNLADALLKDDGVDIIVNNSGGPVPGTASETSADAWDTAFKSMASSIFHLTGKLIPCMKKRGFGRIITIGSSGIIQPIDNLAISNGVRAAIAGWSKTLSNELAAFGITVNMIVPGRIDTERVRSLDEAKADRESKDVTDIKASSAAAIPAKRYGTPEEFAAVAVFLASERASYVTGSTIRVDGGLIKSV